MLHIKSRNCPSFLQSKIYILLREWRKPCARKSCILQRYSTLRTRKLPPAFHEATSIGFARTHCRILTKYSSKKLADKVGDSTHCLIKFFTGAIIPGRRVGVVNGSQNNPYLTSSHSKTPSWHRTHGNIVPNMAGTPIRKILLNALLPMTFLASSPRPAFANRKGFIAHTYPESIKKIAVQKGPEATIRKYGRWNKWGVPS